MSATAISWFDIGWIGGSGQVERLGAHLKYVKRVGSYAKAGGKVVADTISDVSEWVNRARQYVSQRVNSRVAGKVVIALPNDLGSDSPCEVKRYVEKFIEVLKSQTGTAKAEYVVHDEKGVAVERNLHAHIIISPKDANGKAIRIGKKEIEKVRREWEKFLTQEGYTIRKDKDIGASLKHIGPQHLNPKSRVAKTEVIADYVNYVAFKEALRRAEAEYQQSEKEYEEYLKEKSFELGKHVYLDEKHEAVKDAIELKDIALDKAIWVTEKKIKLLKNELNGRFWLFRKKQKEKIQNEIIKEQQKLERLKRKMGQGANYDALTRKFIGEYINTIHHSSERIGISLIHEREKPVNIIVKPGEINKYIPFLRKKNAQGYNVYVTVNELKADAENRKRESFKAVQRNLYLDLDSKNESATQLWLKIKDLIDKRVIPEPSLIVKTSKGNYQTYWRIANGATFTELENRMKLLNAYLNIDHTHDIARVFRLPGFRNKKKGKDDLVTIVDKIETEKGTINATKRAYLLDDFNIKALIQQSDEAKNEYERLKEEINNRLRRTKASVNVKVTRNMLDDYKHFCESRKDKYQSQSELDIAFCIKCLSNNRYSPTELIRLLEYTRVYDKYNVEYYAHRTVGKAVKYISKDITNRLDESEKRKYEDETKTKTEKSVSDRFEKAKRRCEMLRAQIKRNIEAQKEAQRIAQRIARNMNTPGRGRGRGFDLDL